MGMVYYSSEKRTPCINVDRHRGAGGSQKGNCSALTKTFESKIKHKHGIFIEPFSKLLLFQGNKKSDQMLVCLTVLLSSTLIYNVKGVFDTDTIEKISYPLGNEISLAKHF
jgi:hypothetical protein